jgi:hypothetical protein
VRLTSKRSATPNRCVERIRDNDMSEHLLRFQSYQQHSVQLPFTAIANHHHHITKTSSRPHLIPPQKKSPSLLTQCGTSQQTSEPTNEHTQQSYSSVYLLTPIPFHPIQVQSNELYVFCDDIHPISTNIHVYESQ